MKKFIFIIITFMTAFVLASCTKEKIVEKIVEVEKQVIKPEKHLLNENPEDFAYRDFDNPYTNPYTDFYNATSKGSLHIISNFATYQQTTSYSCGPCSTLVTLNYYKYDVKNTYTEQTIIDMIGAEKGVGCNIQQIYDFYVSMDFNIIDYFIAYEGQKRFSSYVDFEIFVETTIDFGNPIQVDWNPGGGHWVTIIGIDTGIDGETSDDTLIFADSSDSYDGYCDGYTTTQATRFFKLWIEGTGSGPDGAKYFQSYIVVEPKSN